MKPNVFLLSGLCSLMLGSALIGAKSGVSMAAVGGTFGDKVALQVQTAGWAVPAKSEVAAPKLTDAIVANPPRALTAGELQAVYDRVEAEGVNGYIPGKVAVAIGLSTGPDLQIKGKVIVPDPSKNEKYIVEVATVNNIRYLVLADRLPDSAYIYVATVDGSYVRGIFAGPTPPIQPIPLVTPGYLTLKQFWKSQLGATTVATNASGN